MFRSHPYRNNEDLSRLKALVAAIWEEEGPVAPFTICDFDWRLFQHPDIDPTRRIRIWENEQGNPVGFAWYTPPGDVDVVIAPVHREMSLFLPMLEWSAAVHRDASGGEDELGVWVVESDVSLPFLLRRLGFVPSDREYFHLLWEPAHALSPPALEAGYRFGQVRGLEDLDRRVDVHRSAFAPARLTRDSYKVLMESAGYRKELDVVVEAPDGSFAAFALGWLDPESGIGQIEPVGTDPAHRGKGLASAATTELLRRLEHAGATQVLISAQSELLVDRLYRDLEFRPVSRSQRYVQAARS